MRDYILLTETSAVLIGVKIAMKSVICAQAQVAAPSHLGMEKWEDFLFTLQ
ncbi:hypothetical protein GU269_18065 [Vibrio cholerae]|nr:hypothetical protein [Vibrio cholerae]EGQ8494175.1 hypothetical protein [Vibrio cholerae]MBW5442734.1 hypothetical protein [Vibrio cholerae]MEB5558435.1 hypothetical protein [Vibrio cholerae]NOE31532.1 hypothetical protein [Vibrio cholerae]